MKLFISSDIEGTAGIVHWDETDARVGGRWYEYFCAQMTREVAAACRGAQSVGVTSILVKDAHDTARNIDPMGLPSGVQINRGWNGGLFSMVAGLSHAFDAVAFTGYHSPSGSGGNPLSHTMRTEVEQLLLNGQVASEFMLHSYVAGMLEVPVVFVSGDAELCNQAKELVPAITAVPVSAGEGDASTSPQPEDACNMVYEGMRRALRGKGKTRLGACNVVLPKHFKAQVRYSNHALAYSMGYYPGAKQVDDKTIEFENSDYYEMLRFFHFVL